MGGTRNVGGVALNTIVTDFGTLNVAIDRALPADAIAVRPLEQVAPVFPTSPARASRSRRNWRRPASDKSQIYGEIGLEYGNQAAHGVLRGLFA